MNKKDRMKYLIGAQKRMLEAKEVEIDKLTAQLRASCLWVAYLADQVMGNKDEIEIDKSQLYQANENNILFSDNTEKNMIILRRTK